MTAYMQTMKLTEQQAKGLGALAARTQMRQIETGERRETNKIGAWCRDRERYAGLRTSENYDAWHVGWDEEEKAYIHELD